MTDSFSRGGPSDAPALSFGPYELVRELRAARFARRYLALQPDRLTNHVAYRIGLDGLGASAQRFLDAVERSASVSSPHVLPIEQFSITSDREAWAISPFVGDHDGLLLLSDLLADKGGMLEPGEVRRAVGQLLEAADAGRQKSSPHGPLSMSEIQVDRRGAVRVELYGLNSGLNPGLADGVSDHATDRDELHHAEVRSILAIGYELLTGVNPDSAAVDPKRLVPAAPDDLCRILRGALDDEALPESAREAIEVIRGSAPSKPAYEIHVKPARRGFGIVRMRGSRA